MDEILIYAFKNKYTYKLVNKFKVQGYNTLLVTNWDKLIEEISNNYKFVLGLGDYRKNGKKIRIETKFVNLYGEHEIIPHKPEYLFSNWDLRLQEDCQISNTSTTGPCNKSAYLILDNIKEKDLRTKFGFVHIPTSWDLLSAKSILDTIINSSIY